MRHAVQHRAGQTFAAEHFRPLLKGKLRRSPEILKHYVLEGRLRSFHLRRDQCLFTHESVEKPIRTGHHRAGDFQSFKGSQGVGMKPRQFALNLHCRFLGQQDARDIVDIPPAS
jgi:hypothetical protein